ncbi:MAG: sugar phosphate nucleotidyltransferase [Kiritimatiellales bacterium]
MNKNLQSSIINRASGELGFANAKQRSDNLQSSIVNRQLPAPPALVIMAAGIGSRYGGLKQIDPVGPSGEIVLDYSVFDAIRAGFGKVVFIIRPDIEAAFKEVIGDKLAGKIDVEYVFQTLDKIPMPFSVPGGRTKPWGTGQAVLMAKPVINEPFAVINADDFYGRESFEVLARQLEKMPVESSDCCMVGFYIKNTLSPNGGVARGYCDVDAGILKHVSERFNIERKPDGIIRYEENGLLKQMNDDDIVSMNTWGFTPQLFEFLERGFVEFLERAGNEMKSEYLLPELIDSMIARGETTARVLPTPEKWMGVTYAEDKPQVMAGIRELINVGIYPENLWM